MASVAKDNKKDEPAVINDEVRSQVLNEAKAMNKMDGEEKKGDILVTGIKLALDAFKEIIPTAKKDGFKYDLRGVHLGKSVCRGKTKEDLYKGFLLWSQKDQDIKTNSFNVSKAFRRFESFATAQEKHYSKTGHFKEPVYYSELENVRAIFPLVVGQEPLKNTPKEKPLDGCLFWAIDLTKCEHYDLKKHGIELSELFRFLWYYLLSSIFDDIACHPGIILCEDIGYMGLGDMMAFSSAIKPIENDLNELFYGCVPLKMKKVIIVNSPWWMNFLIGFMRLFMSKKMSSRIKNDTTEKMYSRVGGPANIPSGYIGGTGSSTERYYQDPKVEDLDNNKLSLLKT
jgi:hypothetical protein